MISLLLILCASSAVAAPMVTKVKINSSLLGKDRFLQHYLHEPGDQFNQAKHDRSLELLHTELKDLGYLLADVSAKLYLDTERDTIAVTLLLNEKERFTIDEVAVLVTDNEELSEELSRSVQKALEGKYAQKELLAEQAKKLRSALVRKGYIMPKIDLITERKEGQLDLIYQVRLTEKKAYTFLGNLFFSKAQLLDEVYALEEQGITLPISLVAQEIIDLYKKKGYEDVQVDWEEEPELVTFFISEGPRHRIGLVTIKEEFTQADALQRLELLEKEIQALGSYDQEALELLLSNASDDLSRRGFWYVVFDKQITKAAHGAKLDITLYAVQPDGNQRITIKAIEVPGHEEVLSQGPFATWQGIQDEQPLSLTQVDEQRRWLLTYLKKNGYLLAKVSYTIKQGILTWQIDLDQGVVRFGPISLAGLYKMKPFIVMRELCFEEGDIWDRQKIEESVQRLKSLGMFESIAICPERGGTSQPVLIKLCEDDPFELRSRFGLQFVSKSFTNLSWSTWKLGGSFIWKNPTGYADRLILDADWTRYTIDIAGTYETPWLGPFPIRSQVSVYTNKFEQPLVSSNHLRLYEESHTGLSVQLQHEHPWWTTSVLSGFEINKVSGIRRQIAQKIDFEPQLVDRRVPYFYIEPSVTFENFDDKTDPTIGYFTTFGLKAMLPPTIQDGWFIRAQLEQSFFYPLYKCLIGALRWRFGHIFNANFSTILPTQRFYLGGANSLRGYETNMAPPLRRVCCDGKEIFVPVGGKTMANVNAELRFPLYRRLSGVLFTDMGVLVQECYSDSEDDDKLLGATGFGLRFASPFGPIRFDIGWKWKKRDPDDKRYAFFFTFGHAF